MAASPQITAKMLLNNAPLKSGLKQSSNAVGKFSAAAKRQLAGIAKGIGLSFAGIGVTLGAAITKGIQQNIKAENTEIMLKSLLGSPEKAKEAMAEIEKVVANSPFTREGIQTAFTELAPFADKDLAKLQRLVHLTAKLSMLNPAQGLSGAAFAVKEALSGDMQSLISRFNLSRSKINELKAAGLSGEKIINRMLTSLGISDETLNDFTNSTTGMINAVRNQLDDASSKLSAGLFAGMKDIIPELVKIIEDNKEQFSTLGRAIATSVTAGVQVAGKVAEVTDVVSAKGSTYLATLWQETSGQDMLDVGNNMLEQIGGTLAAGVLKVNQGLWKGISHAANVTDGWDYADKQAAWSSAKASEAWAGVQALTEQNRKLLGVDIAEEAANQAAVDAASKYLGPGAQLGARTQAVQEAKAQGKPIPPVSANLNLNVSTYGGVPVQMGAS